MTGQIWIDTQMYEVPHFTEMSVGSGRLACAPQSLTDRALFLTTRQSKSKRISIVVLELCLGFVSLSLES